MKKILFIALAVVCISLSGCDNYIRNNFTYSNTAKTFMKSLMQKDYDKCISLMERSKNAERKTYRDSMKTGLESFRTQVEKKLGDNIDYAFLYAWKSKNFNLVEIPDKTSIRLQLSNDQDLCIIEAMFNDKTGKIESINPYGIKESSPIPDTSDFWIFGIIAICIPIFNIYILRRVHRSDMANKWQSYLIIILFNVPAVGYALSHGMFYDFFAGQYFLGFGFVKMGYGSRWIFGVPLGSLYILWKLKKGKYTKDPASIQKPTVKGKR